MRTPLMSRHSGGSRRPFGSRLLLRTWNMRSSTLRRALGGSLCFSESSVHRDYYSEILRCGFSIPVVVNSTPVKAFVDSGAQQTISKFTTSWVGTVSQPHLVSPECAEACGQVYDPSFHGWSLIIDRQDNAACGYKIRWDRERSGHSQDLRKSSQRSTEISRSLSSLLIHNHGGPPSTFYSSNCHSDILYVRAARSTFF